MLHNVTKLKIGGEMTTQTLVEKLRILADAAEAGEGVQIYNTGNLVKTSILLDQAWSSISSKWLIFSRIPKPKEQIQVGERWINAPLRKMPSLGEKFWYTDAVGRALGRAVDRDQYHTDLYRQLFSGNNCWATKEDAIAWHEASVDLRKGGAA